MTTNSIKVDNYRFDPYDVKAKDTADGHVQEVGFCPFPSVPLATQRTWNYSGDELTGYTYKNAAGDTLATQVFTWDTGKIVLEVWTWV
jgi:hypothetical protein